MNPDRLRRNGMDGEWGYGLREHDVWLIGGVKLAVLLMLEYGEDEGIVVGGDTCGVAAGTEGDGERVGGLVDAFLLGA